MENIIKFNSLSSTNLKAKELIANHNHDWTVIVSEEQVSGHGKQESQWYSPLGGLYFSIILPKANIKDIQIITILSSFVVAENVKNKYHVEPMIKLPNDVYINNKKFCGILTENIISGDDIFSVIGIGINTNIDNFPEELKNKTTSLSIELGEKIDNEELLIEIISGLKKYFKEIIN
jgi:BirA family biotin operon repressor/biotin-[acetyl-CoA-carboxylase] ligase